MLSVADHFSGSCFASVMLSPVPRKAGQTSGGAAAKRVVETVSRRQVSVRRATIHSVWSFDPL
jgi:hypothetical protein